MATLAEPGNNAGTIVIFTDFSSAALNATNYAAALAGQLNVTRLLICYSEHIPTTMEMSSQSIRLTQQEHQRHLKLLRNLKDDLQTHLNEKIVIETHIDQRPLDEIVNSYNQEQFAGLVVMGIAGKSRLERTFIGSNTIRVARIATIPLLIVPEHTLFRKIERVVFACDLRKVSKTTPALAIKRMVSTLGAKLSILNVDHNEERFNPDRLSEMTDLHQLWDNEQPEYHYTDNEDIAKGVMDFADEHQMHLVIAVPKAYGFFENLFHSSLTRKLAYHIHLPLLLIKEEKPK
ncbi:universal stress protein [Pedobacter nyackensis]|uniref:universal stress protein n=1 Tax=Pedobacter nyackensis TaxID=475255 RepID=UPI00292CE74D|nr:universal stress protein [Pedobacter nyackensis]